MRTTYKRRLYEKLDPEAPANIVIAKLGGLNAVRRETGLAPSTIWGWQKRGIIPHPRIPMLKDVARRLKVKIKDGDFLPKAFVEPVEQPIPAEGIGQPKD